MTALTSDTRAVLEAIHEAIAIPYGATTAHERTRAEILSERLMHTVVCLESLLRRDNAAELPGTLEYLREMLAKHPAAGYVTTDQARRRVDAGATWMEAVSFDYQDEETGR